MKKKAHDDSFNHSFVEEKEEQEQDQTSLFRKEVIQRKKGNYFGKTLIITPISFSIWSFGIFFIAIIIGLFLYFGEYSKRQTVQGVLIPDKGLITIYAKGHGVVTNKLVQQGSEVEKGQLLYLISTEQDAPSKQSFSAQQLALLKKQIELQKEKITMFEKTAAGYDKLLKLHYVSLIEYQDRREKYLTTKIALYNYEKELSQAEEAVYYAIRAPVDGVISISIPSIGDHVTEETPLGSIIPKNSKLEGQLFVPTSKAGFVKIGQRVLLKYYAYPYQRFGLYEAVIQSIDQSITNPQDVKSISVPVKIEEAFYRVTTALQKQTVSVYGKPYPLTAGMLFDAVILGEKRKIWQWIIDPVFVIFKQT